MRPSIHATKGFSLIELVIYIGILGISAGLLTGILQTVTQTQVEEAAQNEVSGQLTFAVQTIQRLVRESSVIKMEPGVASSTLLLKMSSSDTTDTDLYTSIYLDDGVVYLEDEKGTKQAITSRSVTVDSLSFTKFTQYPAQDIVQIDIALSGIDQVKGGVITRSLRSAVSRASAVTFDSDLLPGSDNSYVVGNSSYRWRDADFSGDVDVAGSVTGSQLCIGAECRSSWGSVSGVSGSGTANYVPKWTAGDTLGNSLIYDNGTNVGIGTATPDSLSKLHIVASNGSDIHIQSSDADSQVGLRLENDAREWRLRVRGANADAFEIRDITANADRFVIDSSGDVGINTTDPQQKLHVIGNIRANDIYTDTGVIEVSQYGSGNRNAYIDLHGDDTYTDYGLRLIRSDGGSNGTSSISHRGTGALILESIEAGSIQFETSNTNRMTIDSAGHVGVGVASPDSLFLDVAGSAGGYSLQLRSGNSNTGTNGSQILFGFNNTVTYRHSVRTRHNAGSDTGNAIDFYVWDYGTDTSTAVGTKRVLTIDGTGTAGRLGIGDSTPDATLDVAGTANVDLGLDVGGSLNVTSDGQFGGNVGIGTSPSYKLDINGNTNVTGNISVTGTVDGYDISAYGPYWIDSAGTNGYVWTSDGSGKGFWNAASSGISGSGTTNYIPKWTSASALGNSPIYIGGGSEGSIELKRDLGTGDAALSATGATWGLVGEGGTYGVYGSGTQGVRGEGSSYDFYAGGSGTNYGPFTGAHDVLIADNKNYQPGLIVSATGTTHTRFNDDGFTSLSSTLPQITLASFANDSAVLGVYIQDNDDELHWYQKKSGERIGIVNALGEGRVWVTDINGPISVGDYITTSAVAGYGQKQDDDLMHSYTLGKSTETPDWDNAQTITHNGKTYRAYLIGVVYTSG